MDTGSYSALKYTQNVRQRFKNDLQVYHKFVEVLREMQKHESDKIGIIHQLISLLAGNRDLIIGLNPFLPPEYQLEIQQDAVLIKVQELVPATLQDTSSAASGNQDMQESLGYVRQVKHTFWDEPAIYHQFMSILHEFHQRKLDHMQTIRSIIELFKDSPGLITGFNAFLPQGYKISTYEPNSYIIHLPQEYKRKKSVHYATDIEMQW